MRALGVKLRPLQEQPVLLTAEASLHPPKHSLPGGPPGGGGGGGAPRTQVHLTAGSFNLSTAFLFQILGHYHVVIGIIKVEVGERKVYMER